MIYGIGTDIVEIDRIKKIKSHIDSLGISRTHVSIADERNHLIAFAVFEI